MVGHDKAQHLVEIDDAPPLGHRELHPSEVEPEQGIAGWFMGYQSLVGNLGMKALEVSVEESECMCVS